MLPLLSEAPFLLYNGTRMREYTHRRNRNGYAISGGAVLNGSRERRIDRILAGMILSIGFIVLGALSYFIVSGRLLAIWMQQSI